MKKIEIILENGLRLDVADDIVIPITYQVDDIANILTSNGTFTKTVKLPSSKNNNTVLGNIYDINVDFSVFNPSIRTNAKIVINGFTVLDGFFKLTKINKIHHSDIEGDQFIYDCVFYDSSVLLFEELKGKLLINNEDPADDIDLSAFSHTLTRATMEDAWANNTWEDCYQYPLLKSPPSSGTYQVDNFRPAIYHKKLMETMLNGIGYQVGGDFWDTNTRYEKEIIPFLSLDDDEVQVADLPDKTVTVDTPLSYPVWLPRVTNYTQNLAFASRFSNEVSDPNNQWASSTQKLTILDNGTYDLQFSGRFDITHKVYKANGSAYSGADEVFLGREGIVKGVQNHKDQTTTITRPEASLYCSVTVNSAARGSFTVKSSGMYVNNTNGTVYDSSNNWESSATLFFNQPLLRGQQLRTGDVVELKFALLPDSSDWYGMPSYYTQTENVIGGGFFNITEYIPTLAYQRYTYGFTSATRFSLTAQDVIPQGYIIDPTISIPRNFKKSDLLLDIIKRYNLYITTDPTDNRKIILKTSEQFYDTGVELDWSDKVDYSKPTNITLLPDLQSKNLIFTYTNDTGSPLAKAYSGSTQGDIYGQKKIEFTNEFSQGTTVIKTPFAPAPLRSLAINGNAVIIPWIYQMNSEQKLPSVLYWGGLIDNVGTYQWKLLEKGGTSGSPTLTGTLYDQWPYAGHFDNPLNPTFDINFGPNDFYFYEDVTPPTDNLYTSYWEDYINYIATGRMLTATMVLDEVDLSFIKDNMNARIWIKNSWYNINKIKDSNPSINGLTTVELLKL